MHARSTILVTGFGPFPGVEYNPSGAAASAIDGQREGAIHFSGQEIPCSWAGAWPALMAAVERVQPVALVMLGVASERAQIEIERVARNVRAQKPDCEGCLPEACLPGLDRYETTLPWAALPEVAVSDHAGDYLCNDVFYRAMAELVVPMRGFVHVPPGPIEPTLAFLRRFARTAGLGAQP